MKKIAQFHEPDKSSSTHLVLAVDVSSRLLDLYSRYRQRGMEFELSESVLNDLPTIHQKLDEYHKQACGLGYSGLKHLGQTAWVLARKDRVLGPYYHRKLTEVMPAGYSVRYCPPILFQTAPPF